MEHIFRKHKVYILGYIPPNVDIESKRRFAQAERVLQNVGFREINIRNAIKTFENKKLSKMEILRHNFDMLINSDTVYVLSDKIEKLYDSIEFKIVIRLNMVVIHDTFQVVDPQDDSSN